MFMFLKKIRMNKTTEKYLKKFLKFYSAVLFPFFSAVRSGILKKTAPVIKYAGSSRFARYFSNKIQKHFPAIRNFILKTSALAVRLFRKIYSIRAGRYFINSVMFYLLLSVISALMLPVPLIDRPFSKILMSSENDLLGAKISSDDQWRFQYNEEIPYKFRTALLDFEDKRFFYHPGIDPAAVARSVRLNLKYGKIVSGGSTISMQVIRIYRQNSNRTFTEKFIEAFLTLGLELKYSKKEILNMYSANAPFGGNIVGLSTASWRYFNRSPENLSWAESALLAVLPNSPSLMHPGRNRDTLKKKRDNLLLSLQKKGVISEIDYLLAVDEPLPLKPAALDRDAPHLLETLSIRYRNKYIFRSTLSTRIQKRTNEILLKHSTDLKARGIFNIAAIVIDNETGNILAYCANTPEGFSEDGGENIFSSKGYAVDIIRSPRSTGSILKPFLYAAMLKDGEITPFSIVSDIPSQFRGYVPENFDRSFSGAVPARDALTRSLNVPAVKMLQEYGLYRFYNLLKNLEMSTLFRTADDYGLTLILGGAETTLFDISSMYSYLAQTASGRKPQSTAILQDEKQHSINTGNLTEGPAYLTMEALLEVVRPENEGYWKSFASSRRIAWKTGTSLGMRDAWAVGCTEKYTVGVWAGNAYGEGIPSMTGFSASAPVLFDIFNTLEKSPWFKIPYSDLKKITVCTESGNLPTEICRTKTIYIPMNSHFDTQCTYHRLIHLDKTGTYQVDSSCESTSEMIHVPWFILPAAQEHFYRKSHPEYKTLPPVRSDCLDIKGNPRNMSLIYPGTSTAIYIPLELDGKPGYAVFQAAHRKSETVIYWHIDDQYIGQTKNFHEMQVNTSPGRHVLTIVDENGEIIEQQFEILARVKK